MCSIRSRNWILRISQVNSACCLCDRAALKDRLDNCDRGKYDPEAEDNTGFTLFSDEDITLTKIGEGHAEEWSDKGSLSLTGQHDRVGIRSATQYAALSF